jgi:hypothetical protein
MARIFPTVPGIVPCVKTVRTNNDYGYGRSQVAEGSLAGSLQKVRDEQRNLVVRSRARQAEGNPFREQWADESPEIQDYYDSTISEAKDSE